MARSPWHCDMMASACPKNVHKVELISIFLFSAFQQQTALTKRRNTWEQSRDLWTNKTFFFLCLDPGDMINWWFFSQASFFLVPFFLPNIFFMHNFPLVLPSSVENEDFANANCANSYCERNLFNMKTEKCSSERMECFHGKFTMSFFLLHRGGNGRRGSEIQNSLEEEKGAKNCKTMHYNWILRENSFPQSAIGWEKRFYCMMLHDVEVKRRVHKQLKFSQIFENYCKLFLLSPHHHCA